MLLSHPLEVGGFCVCFRLIRGPRRWEKSRKHESSLRRKVFPLLFFLFSTYVWFVSVVCKEADVDLLQAGNRQTGAVYLTNYRLVFVPSKRNGKVSSVPLGCIAQLDVHFNVLRVLCKYFRLLELCWAINPPPDVSVSSYMWGGASVSSSVLGGSPLMAFRQAICDQLATPFCLVGAFQAEQSPASSHPVLYTGIAQELRRLNVPASEWRISSANEQYLLCSSYPRFICVPASVTDDELRVVATFRSHARVPALCW